MYSLDSRQMILQEGDPLCWVLLWLACYGGHILGRLEIVCSQGFHEVDEATLHETSSGLIYLAEGSGHRRGEREAREEVRPAHCRLGWGLSQASAKLKQDCSVHTVAGVGTLYLWTLESGADRDSIAVPTQEEGRQRPSQFAIWKPRLGSPAAHGLGDPADDSASGIMTMRLGKTGECNMQREPQGQVL